MASSRKKIEIKIEEICRTCLAKEIELFSMFDIFLEAITLDHVITSITGVKIDKSDGLPTKICQECKDKATNAYNFKRKSQEAEVTLYGIFRKEKDLVTSGNTAICSENKDVDVKMESYPSDENEDYIDLEYNLALPVPRNRNKNRDVKNETCVSVPLRVKSTSMGVESEISQDQTKTKCIKVEYEDSSSTSCPLCGTCYIDSDDLTKHMSESHADVIGAKKRGRKKKMTILNKLSKNGNYLKTVSVKQLNCSYCKKKFKTKEELGAHMNEHKDVKNETCVSETLQVKSTSMDADSDSSQDQSKKKCIKVEYEYNSSTSCPLCGTCYIDSDGLTKHMWESHADIMGPKKRGRPKKMVTDTILNKLSENGYYLKTVPVKQLNCSFCMEKFKTKEELVTHMNEHKDTKVLCCIICKKMYLKKKYFDIHLCAEDKAQSSHLQENNPPIVLPKNGQVEFMIETSLNQLLDLSNNPEACASWQACAACSTLVASSAALAEHVDALHPELSLRCALCTKVFATVKSATRHRGKCSRIERTHECSTCGQRYAHEVTLNKHILHSHAGQSVSVKFVAGAAADGRRYQCDTCNRCFFRKDLLANHTKNHKSSDKYFECDICKKRFHRSDNLRSHMRVHGGSGAGAGACLCLYCGRSFTNSSNLIVHMRRHTGEKPYKCDLCDKGFPRSSDLQCHRRSHTGEKPYICGVCGKGFSRSNKLSRHMRVHTGLRPYKCSYCEKAFSQSNDLNLHVRRHTGDKPYICELCGDRFIQGTALHNHRRTHGHYPPTATSSAPLPAPLTAPLSAPLPAPLLPTPPAQITVRARR